MQEEWLLSTGSFVASAKTKRMNSIASFEKDHGERLGLKVSWTQLDEGRGIAETIQAHNAKYHKVYKTYCSNSRLNSFTDKNDSADPKLTEVSLLHIM